MAYSAAELLATSIAAEIENGTTVAIGTLSAIPAAAALLAQATHAPDITIIMLGSRTWWPFTGGSNEFFDFCQRGKVDLFFLSGAQIDQYGNLNLVSIGEHSRPAVRFPGGAGSSMMSFMAGKTIVFKTDHSRRSMVERVDFVSAPGFTSRDYYRMGRAEKVITPLATFAYDQALRRLRVVALQPGVTKDDVRANTGFAPIGLDDALQAAPPTDEQLELLRTTVKAQLAEVYPVFASGLGVV